MWIRVALAALLACAWLAHPAAGATTQPLLLEEHAGPVAADGRYVWFTVYPSGHPEHHQPLRLLDTRKGTDQRIAPAGCETMPNPGVRRALLICEQAPRYRLLDLDSGAVAPSPADDCKPPPPSGSSTPSPNYGETQFVVLGRHWVQGTFHASYHIRGGENRLPIFFNWRTGACRSFASSRDGWRDIDDPKLPKRQMPRCGQRGVDFTVVRSLGQADKPMKLRLCRERRVVSIRCTSYCEFQGFRGGLVAWTEGGGVVKAQVLRTGRRHAWRFPDHDPGSGYSSPFVAMAGGDIYVSTAQREPGHWRVHAVDVPR